MMGILAKRIAGAEAEASPARAIVTDGVGQLFGIQDIVANQGSSNTRDSERIQITEIFDENTIDTAETDSTPYISFQTDVGGTLPFDPVFPVRIRPLENIECVVAGEFRAVVQAEASFELEGGFHAGTELFRTLEADTAVFVAAHADVGAGFLDQAGIHRAVNGDVGLGVCSTCAGAQYSQCDKSFFHDCPLGKINKIPVSNAPCQSIRGRRPVSGTGICFHSMNTGQNTGKGAGTVFSFY